MLRLFITVAPLLVAVGCTFAALKLRLPGSDEDRAAKLLAGSFAVGVVFSLMIWWQQASLVDQAAEARQAAANNKASQAWGDVQTKSYQEKITALNAEVNSLRAQLSKRSEGSQVPVTDSAIKQQSSTLPKIYWTVQNIGSGQAAVKFKVYGPLNIPAFVAICDHPCRAISGQIGTGSEGTPVVGATSNIAGYVFKKPRPIPAGTDGFVIVEPASAAVTQFKILGETEIPEAMR
jgi:hypothetical protein